jgi:hypothetical protein
MSSSIRRGGICAKFTKRGPNPKALAMVVIRPPKTIAPHFAVTSECICEKRNETVLIFIFLMAANI